MTRGAELTITIVALSLISDSLRARPPGLIASGSRRICIHSSGMVIPRDRSGGKWKRFVTIMFVVYSSRGASQTRH